MIGKGTSDEVPFLLGVRYCRDFLDKLFPISICPMSPTCDLLETITVRILLCDIVLKEDPGDVHIQVRVVVQQVSGDDQELLSDVFIYVIIATNGPLHEIYSDRFFDKT